MPTESPISDVDTIDIVGERHDGGTDLVVVLSGPVDGGSATLAILEKKIQYYIAAVRTSEFKRKYNYRPDAQNSIYIVTEGHTVDPMALEVIDRLKPLARAAGTTLRIRRSMN